MMQLQEALNILGLTESAGHAEIRHAYAKLSKTYHVETDPEQFSRLHEAYKTALAAVGRMGAGQQDMDTGAAPARMKAPNDIGRKPLFKDAGTSAKDANAIASRTKDEKNTGTVDSPTKTQTDNLLDRLLGKDFSILNCSKPIQLLHYLCRYNETSSDIDAVLLRITNAEQGTMDEAHLQREAETVLLPPDDRKFLGIPWRNWKTLGWTCIICHPGFFRIQDTPAFLDELYHFLSEEMLNLRDGIRQELYFALCMAYGFFLPGIEEKPELSENSLLVEIRELLRRHPKHSEYKKDLALWPDCKQNWQIVLFCHKAYTILMPSLRPVSSQPRSGQADSGHPVFGQPPSGQADPNPPVSGQTPSGQADSNPPVSGPSTSGTEKNSGTADMDLNAHLPEAAAELLLDEGIPWKEFIYDRLADLSHGSLLLQFNEKREAFHELHNLQKEFTKDFINLLDNHVAENYIYSDRYVRLAARLNRIKKRYLTNPQWKKIICRPAFFAAFKEWLFPHRNGFSSVPCLMHYDTWKMLRTCFAGNSDFEAEATRYLTEEYYFPEYEKRYARELVWENERIWETYFVETFPVPALSQGKLDLLDSMENATPANIVEIEKIWGNLAYNSAGLEFLTRITNAMTHFNFLLVTQKNEKEAVPGDAFCFLKYEVLLYRKKENLLCRLRHPVFYDLISWKFEAAAYPALNGKPGYDEDFLDTACKNLYLYRCYVMKKKIPGMDSWKI